MTSEAHPPDDNRLGRADRRLRARLLPRHPRRRRHPQRRKRSGTAVPLRLERPAPVKRTSPGPGRRNEGRLRGRVAGRGRPRMDAVGGLRGHQRHLLTGAETRGAARRLSPG